MQTQNISGGTDIATTQYSFSGQPLINILKHEKAGTNAATQIVVSKTTYDDLGRITKTEKNLNSAGYKTISELEYDAIGQLKKKKLGTKPGTSNALEELVYDYNIRGWMLGVNRDYVKDANTTNYFGFELSYDKANAIIAGTTYSAQQYNGNISGTIWKSKGDAEKRKFDYTYDAVNRLTGADFNQYTGGFNKSAGVDFSISNLSYDANGNILSMSQNGLKLSSSSPIDQMSYSYEANSNKLKQVTDAVNDNQSKLGDFKYDASTKTSTDYSYDINGNLITDQNKRSAALPTTT